MIALALSLVRVASSIGARTCSRAVVFVIVASKEIKRVFRIVYRGGEGRGWRKPNRHELFYHRVEVVGHVAWLRTSRSVWTSLERIW